MTTIYKNQFCLLNKAFTEMEGHIFTSHISPVAHMKFWQRVTRHTVPPEGCAWWLILLMPKVPLAGGAKACPARTANQPSWNPKQDQQRAPSPAWHTPAQYHLMTPPATGFASLWQDSPFPLLSKAPLCAFVCFCLYCVSICLGNKGFRAQQEEQKPQLLLTYRSMLMENAKYQNNELFSQ